VLVIKDEKSKCKKIYLVAFHISCDITEDGGTYKVSTFVSWNLFAHTHVEEIEITATELRAN